MPTRGNTMSFETQQTFLGKTQAIHISEMASEKVIFGARLVMGLVYTAVSLGALFLNRIDISTFVIGLVAFGILGIANLYCLLFFGRKPVAGFSAYGLIFLDVTFITTIIWSYATGVTPLLHLPLFSAYFIVITFAALHYRAGLVFWGGALCALEYSLFFFWWMSRQAGVGPEGLNLYLIQMFILLLVTFLSIYISRNNAMTIQKVVSSEVRYQNLVHRLPEMLFTLDADRNFIWANMASYAILGIPAKAIRHRSIQQFFVDPPLKIDTSGLRGTFEIRDFDGTRKYVDCVIQPVREEGTNAAFDGILTDVTDRELAISQREEMVSRLYQYQKMESLGTLASGMAHDFNNILQTISDLVAVVQQESAEAQTQRRMELMAETLVDARFLVSELLAIGQKAPLNHATVDLCGWIPEVVEHFQKQLGERYSMETDVPATPITIRGDKDYLKRIFQNFFVNARDAMPRGGTITVSCSIEESQGGGGYAVVRFADSGIGIPADIVDKIFDPFFTTKRPGKGTGLGLALVQRVVTLHNGSVSVERTGGKGTIFKILFPLIDAADDSDDTRWMSANRIPSRLLLLDDDQKIRDVLSFFLKDFGYDICEASNLADAMGHLGRYRDECGVVVMDWKLSDADPHRVVRSLRQIKPDIVVIVVSGYPPDAKSIEELSIQRWFTKPYDKDQLDVEIQRSLHLRAATDGR